MSLRCLRRQRSRRARLFNSTQAVLRSVAHRLPAGKLAAAAETVPRLRPEVARNCSLGHPIDRSIGWLDANERNSVAMTSSERADGPNACGGVRRQFQCDPRAQCVRMSAAPATTRLRSARCEPVDRTSGQRATGNSHAAHTSAEQRIWSAADVVRTGPATYLSDAPQVSCGDGLAGSHGFSKKQRLLSSSRSYFSCARSYSSLTCAQSGAGLNSAATHRTRRK